MFTCVCVCIYIYIYFGVTGISSTVGYIVVAVTLVGLEYMYIYIFLKYCAIFFSEFLRRVDISSADSFNFSGCLADR